jgi:hypothetical protein
MPIKSIQYDLFALFVTNEPNSVSNTVDLWESIPKYFFTPNQVGKLRTADGLAKPYKWEYSYNGFPCAVKIQPALIEEEDGNFRACFPGVTEELVEEALKKFFTDKHYGTHDPQNSESWIRFSLSMIFRELKARGRTRNYDEIKRAIEIMNKCNIAFFKDGKELWSGAILQDLVTVDRKEYIADTDSQHIARLPLFISQAINQLEYRQFNYDRLMSCNEQLARWIYKRLINRFRQASFMNEYHFMYSDIEQSSGLLQQGRETDNRKKVISSLKELQKCGILMRYTADERKQGRKVIDIKYTLYAGSDFIREQKAANKRATNSELMIAVDNRK